jgi:plasmid stabilization system protein ParE
VEIRFRAEAADDVVVAVQWYGDRHPGLGAALVKSLTRLLGTIKEFPEAFPELATGLRRALVPRFPYAVYYLVADDVVDIVACLHTRRMPGLWQGRD